MQNNNTLNKIKRLRELLEVFLKECVRSQPGAKPPGESNKNFLHIPVDAAGDKSGKIYFTKSIRDRIISEISGFEEVALSINVHGARNLDEKYPCLFHMGNHVSYEYATVYDIIFKNLCRKAFSLGVQAAVDCFIKSFTDSRAMGVRYCLLAKAVPEQTKLSERVTVYPLSRVSCRYKSDFCKTSLIDKKKISDFTAFFPGKSVIEIKENYSPRMTDESSIEMSGWRIKSVEHRNTKFDEKLFCQCLSLLTRDPINCELIGSWNCPGDLMRQEYCSPKSIGRKINSISNNFKSMYLPVSHDDYVPPQSLRQAFEMYQCIDGLPHDIRKVVIRAVEIINNSVDVNSEMSIYNIYAFFELLFNKNRGSRRGSINSDQLYTNLKNYLGAECLSETEFYLGHARVEFNKELIYNILHIRHKFIHADIENLIVEAQVNYVDYIKIAETIAICVIRRIIQTKKLPRMYVPVERAYRNSVKTIGQTSVQNLVYDCSVGTIIDFTKNVKKSHKRINKNDPLFWAIVYGRTDVIEELIDVKYDLQKRDMLGNTYLHYSALFGNLEAAKLLLQTNGKSSQCGSYFELRDWRGRSAAHTALINRKLDVLRVLLNGDKTGSLANATDNQMKSLLHFIPEENFSPYLDLLLSRTKLLNQKDSFGNTPLHIAAMNGNLRVVMRLVGKLTDNYIPMDEQNNFLMTPAQAALLFDHHDTYTYLENI